MLSGVYEGQDVDTQVDRTDTHTHWEAEARPRAGICGCRDELREAIAQGGR